LFRVAAGACGTGDAGVGGMNGTKVRHTGQMTWRCQTCDPETAGIKLVVELKRPDALLAVEITCKKCAKRYRWESQGRWGVVGPWG
jgi:hypothetical protein